MHNYYHPDFAHNLRASATDMSSNHCRTYSTVESYYTDWSQFLTTVQRKLLLENLQANLRLEYRRH